MSEFIEKIIEEKGKEIKEETIEDINKATSKASERFQRVIEELKEQAKIVLPVNIVDILSKGGIVRVAEVNIPSEGYRTTFDIGDRRLFYEDEIRLKPGSYRVLLIFERLGEKTSERLMVGSE